VFHGFEAEAGAVHMRVLPTLLRRISANLRVNFIKSSCNETAPAYGQAEAARLVPVGRGNHRHGSVIFLDASRSMICRIFPSAERDTATAQRKLDQAAAIRSATKK
jgi:hypothetical protein